MKRVPSAQLVFLGGPDQSWHNHADIVQRTVAQIGMEAHVTFLGHRDDALEIISAFA